MAMNICSHRLPDDVFGVLAAGGGGIRALHHLAAAQYSKQVLLLRGVEVFSSTLNSAVSAGGSR